jgi:hypothetical protein
VGDEIGEDASMRPALESAQAAAMIIVRSMTMFRRLLSLF